MTIDKIKNPQDILEFMKENIKYGWLDINGEEHIGNMKNFRKLYRTSSTEEVLQHGIGTCIEQVKLMSELLTKIGIPNKMFCTRIYEGKDFNDLEAEEHMHCFVLYYLDNKVYQLEHPNPEKVGIYEYNSEDEALQTINNYYIEMSGGKSRPITEYYDVKPNISFKEFNNYINSLDKKTK
ncbi:MAG: transglutaminase domain-containing protein [Bacilli bacterium]|nr:transglutaminase domain-containing protein [Bacilli bacterium]